MNQLWEEMRAVATELDSLGNKQVCFPGWDFEHGSPDLIHAIRNAAFAVLNNTDYDSSIKVSCSELGSLVRYIADMLEE